MQKSTTEGQIAAIEALLIFLSMNRPMYEKTGEHKIKIVKN